MVFGPEVSLKYNAILAGRQAEVYAGKSLDQCRVLQDEVLEFADMVRKCNREDFEEWYQLYKGAVYVKPRKKGIRG